MQRRDAPLQAPPHGMTGKTADGSCRTGIRHVLRLVLLCCRPVPPAVVSFQHTGVAFEDGQIRLQRLHDDTGARHLVTGGGDHVEQAVVQRLWQPQGKDSLRGMCSLPATAKRSQGRLGGWRRACGGVRRPEVGTEFGARNAQQEFVFDGLDGGNTASTPHMLCNGYIGNS